MASLNTSVLQIYILEPKGSCVSFALLLCAKQCARKSHLQVREANALLLEQGSDLRSIGQVAK